MDGYGYVDRVATSVAALIVVVVMVAVLLWLVVIALAGGLALHFLLTLARRRGEQTQERREAPLAPTHWFGAPPLSQWLAAYDYWLFQLENVTGINFTASPGRLLAGALIISMAPAMVIGLPWMALNQATGGIVFLGLLVVSGGLGLATAYQLVQPATTWLKPPQRSIGSSQKETGGFLLGEEDW